MKRDSRIHPDYPYPFTPSRTVVNGHELSCLDEGAGPAVVMLHGNPTWSFFYREAVLRLRDRFRVIVPDHLGCGLSDKPLDYPYRLRDHIDNVECLLDRLGVDRYSLVVHDWGGAIGMGLAARRPERVASLVIMNTAAFPSRRIPLRIRLCRVPLLGPLLVRGLNGFARAALFMAVKNPLPPAVARGYLAPYDSWDNRIALLRFVQDIPLAENHPSRQTLLAVEKGLDSFNNTPALILWGGGDFCFTREFYEEWRRRLPRAEYRYFPGAGHYLLEDAGEEALAVLDDFLVRSAAR